MSRHYEFYRAQYDPFHPEGIRRMESFISWLPRFISPGWKVLDLGCGTGISSFALCKLNCQVVGVDIREDAINQAREYAEKLHLPVTFAVMDMRELHFPSGEFDAVTLLGFPMPHFSIKDFDAIASSVQKVLKAKGVFLIEFIDWLALLFHRYEKSLVEESGGKILFSFHSDLNTREGYIERKFFEPENPKPFQAQLYLWAPFLLEFVLYKNHFENIILEQRGGDAWIASAHSLPG
ncbi:MAG: class I SAM-dependent methyltransferase [bacterium]